MTTHYFTRIKNRAVRTGKCRVCGKRATRSRVFEQTVNPFNCHDDGTPRTHLEVAAAVQAEAALWEPDFTHEKCAEVSA